jgi:predicted anti-sigma-YlaC factor YlaD
MTAMTCQTAREAMLDAELDELRGTGSSELAEHLRGCAACRARAGAIVEGYASLDAGLRALRPAHAGARVTPIGRRRSRYAWLPLPLAAAAVLALLLARPASEPLPDVQALARRISPERPVVQPPAGKQAVVMMKNDVTIVWLYNQETL